MRLKKWDILLFLLPIAIAAVSIIIMILINSGESSRAAVVRIDGETVYTLPLYDGLNEEIPVNAKYNNKIVVSDGSVAVVSADCKDNTCVKRGYISEIGESIVCVPSRLSITIEKIEEAGK